MVHCVIMTYVISDYCYKAALKRLDSEHSTCETPRGHLSNRWDFCYIKKHSSSQFTCNSQILKRRSFTWQYAKRD